MRKTIAFLCLFAAISFAVFTDLFAGGDASDPLVTLSYVRKIYTAAVEQNASSRASALLTQKGRELQTVIDERITRRVAEKMAGAVVRAIGLNGSSDAGVVDSSRAWRVLTLSQGDVVSGPAGAGVMLLDGSAATSGSAELIDITHGRALAVGVAAAPNTYYMVSQAQNAGLRITSERATVSVKDGAAVTHASDGALYEDEANRLNAIGLFRGSNRGYELSRRPTRQEALIMLIRLLGEESAALDYAGRSTFTDLTGWPDGIKYVAYGQHMKYTNGMTATEFSQQTPADANMYCTYVLRALGYSDAGGDFTYRGAIDKAVELGLITTAQYGQLQTTGLLRDHMALISYNALWASCKSGGQTLGERLVERGVLTRAQLDGAKK